MEEPLTNAPVPSGPRSPAVPDYAVVLERLREEPISAVPAGSHMRAPTLRDFVAVIFRRRSLVVASFLAVFLVVVLGTWMRPKKYESSMKILVKRERADTVVSPLSSAQPLVVQDLTLEDLNSEVELLQSRDLLEKVVVSCGLHKRGQKSSLRELIGFRTPANKEQAEEDPRIPGAVQALSKSLVVEPIAKSKLIEVRYASEDPKLAAQVLQMLSGLYLEKHLTVHRPPGALDFFQQQTDQYKKGLAKAERQLAEFDRNEGVVSVDLEKDITLRRLNDIEAQLRDTQASRAAVEQRIKSLEAQAATTPARVVTQVRTSDDPSLQQLKTTLLGLEMKRTELLTKYEPEYRTVKEIDEQIAQARAALEQAEKKPLREEMTGLDQTRLWLDEELARARAEMATLNARETQIQKSLDEYRARVGQIGRREIQHSDLARTVKTAEENYLLYLRKQEEARISDELDRKRIVNVAIAESATVPALPSGPGKSLYLILGFLLATLVSLGLAFIVDYMDPSFRTPDEVEAYLGVPVIASFPRN